jgi:hypothetical protein
MYYTDPGVGRTTCQSEVHVYTDPGLHTCQSEVHAYQN